MKELTKNETGMEMYVPTGEMLTAIQENMGGQIDFSMIDRVRIPSGGGRGRGKYQHWTAWNHRKLLAVCFCTLSTKTFTGKAVLKTTAERSRIV